MKEILSERAACYAQRKYQEVLPLLKKKGERVLTAVDKLTGNEKTLMKFLYGTMPLNDAVDYEPELFYSYIKHGLFLRENSPWTRELSEEMFLNYVLYHRVNNEAITDCRSWFYEMLNPFLEECSAEEAVKRINYWCASQASYAASDQRTLSPAAVFASGSGRCGEESTFLVTALRSVGIAARQVYAPRWAHCDDNHAWVEAWVDGSWHFLGACEPEEVLDKGWFTNASSRAMLVHTRVFSDYFDREQEKPEITGRDGAAYLLNITGTYAKTGLLTVRVKDKEGRPVPDARVSFELLNMAEYYGIAELYTDQEGKVSLTLGLGSIRLCVSKDGCYAEQSVENGRVSEVEVILSEGQEFEQQGWHYFDHKSPRDFPMHPVTLTQEQKIRGREKKQEADRRRKIKLEGFDVQAERLSEELQKGEQEGRKELLAVRDILKASRGNAPEIFRFLKAHPGKEVPEFLSVLSLKDYRDIRAELLEEHFIRGEQVREFSCEEYLKGEKDARELFFQYVWNPRIGYEEITPYRSVLDEVLTSEQKKDFCRKPEKVWEWVQEITDDRERKKTLFVALCRTLGIPARLHPVTGEAEYYQEHKFHSVSCPEKNKQNRLILTCQEEPEYYASWTIGRLIREPGRKKGEYFEKFETLNYMGKEFKDGALTLFLEEGSYRLITTVRLPDGNQLEARRIVNPGDFMVGEDGVAQLVLELELRKPKLSQMAEELLLESFSLENGDGTRASDQEVTGDCYTLLAFLEEGAEPTEHLLNELLEGQREVAESGLRVVFVASGKEALGHPTLANAVRLLGAQVYYDDFQELPEQMARRMYVDPEKLPLVVLVGPGRIGRYASSGYNVGSVGLLLRIAQLVHKS